MGVGVSLVVIELFQQGLSPFGNELVDKCLDIGADIRIGVLVDTDGSGGVGHVDDAQPASSTAASDGIGDFARDFD
jgi:hypothetical protein